MQSTQEMVDELYREKLARARSMTPEEKFLAGGELFEMSLEFMEAGIRHQHPLASDAEVEEMIQARLDLQRRMENGA